MKILFVYDHKYPNLWKDGLFAAIELLSKKHDVKKFNLSPIPREYKEPLPGNFDFVLGWGAFNSPVDMWMHNENIKSLPKGLCLAGNAFPYESHNQIYDVIFYETEWSKQWLEQSAKAPLPKLVHAFGYNSTMYFARPTTMPQDEFLVDYLTVGAFATWKRQEKLLTKLGTRMAIGEIQKDNLSESLFVIAPLLTNNVIISDMMPPEILAKIYRTAETVYIPAEVNGGGERAVLEAQASGCKVEVEDDNPKLKELIGKTWDEKYYASQLEKGILDENKS